MSAQRRKPTAVKDFLANGSPLTFLEFASVSSVVAKRYQEDATAILEYARRNGLRFDGGSQVVVIILVRFVNRLFVRGVSHPFLFS